MSDDPIKDAEKRGYGRGYVAGRRFLQRQREVERIQRERDAFRRRAFLAALPAFIEAQNWTIDGKNVTMLTDRVELAWRAADESMKRYW